MPDNSPERPRGGDLVPTPPRASKDVIRTFIEYAPVAIAMLDHDLRYLAASARWRHDFHLGDEPLEGRSHYQVFPDIPEHWKAVHRRCLEGNAEHSQEELFERANGERQWLRWDVQPWRAEDGTIGGLVLFTEDITARKTTTFELERIREQQHQFAETTRLLLATAAQGIVSVDQDGAILMANAAIEAMFGYGSSELIGQPIEQLLPRALRAIHAEHRGAYFAAPRPRPMGLGLDLVGQRRNGSTFPVEVSLNHVHTQSGANAIAFVTDITQRKRTEAALRERTAELEERTQRLSELSAELTLAEQHAREELAKMLHDGLQQLLFSSRLRLGRLVARLPATETTTRDLLEGAQRDLDEAIKAARSLAVELSPPAVHDQGLAAGLAWLAERVQLKYGLVVDVAADPEANPSRRDVRTLIFESVRELLFNVVKHAKTDHASVDLSLTAEGDIRIVVADSGAGFDPATVLNPALPHKPGLGVFSVRERLAQLGGRLEIESAPGEGTRFTLIAPRAGGLERRGPTSGPNEPPGLDAKGARLRPLTVLIADDHALVRNGLRELLADHLQLKVVGEAANGHEALAQAHILHPDVVVMDVSMPHLNGIEATRRLRAELPATRVFGISTEEQPEGLHAIEQAGATGYFTKGDDARRLVDRLLVLHATGR